MVSATDLTRVFGDFVAVDRVSFEVAPGEIFGFLGSNGAGKTTVIRMLCGLLRPTSGSGTVAGFDISTQAAQIKTRIGYMSQRFSLYNDLTVDENIRFWAGTYRLWGRPFEERRDWAYDVTGLGGRRKSIVGDLPGGFRQRLALSCALLHRPSVVFLDEPTGGVDPEARRTFWDLIDDLSAEGVTVFVTTHYMDEAERCHRVALMHAGKLLALDTIPRLIGDHAHLGAVGQSVDQLSEDAARDDDLVLAVDLAPHRARGIEDDEQRFPRGRLRLDGETRDNSGDTEHKGKRPSRSDHVFPPLAVVVRRRSYYEESRRWISRAIPGPRPRSSVSRVRGGGRRRR